MKQKEYNRYNLVIRTTPRQLARVGLSAGQLLLLNTIGNVIWLRARDAINFGAPRSFRVPGKNGEAFILPAYLAEEIGLA